MLAIHDLWVFVIAGLLLNITPGADTLYIVGRSTAQGARAGAMAALGVGAGCCIHTLAAALGLSAILATSATAFTLVKIAGAAYLVYLGVSLLRSRGAADVHAPMPTTPLTRVFLHGMLTNALNPKVALFFLSFLPQFIDPDAPHKVLSFLLLGVIFNVNGTLWNLFLAWSSARVGASTRQSGRFARWRNRAVGSLLIVLGAKLAFTPQQ